MAVPGTGLLAVDELYELYGVKVLKHTIKIAHKP